MMHPHHGTKPFHAPHPEPFSDRTRTRAKQDKGGFRVLLVDDDSLIRTVCTRSLNANGYAVTAVQDGEYAWEQLCSESYDLLITDHKMPRLTGLNLIRRIRKAKIPLPSILISGHMPTDEPDIHMLIQPGGFLQKPFDMQSLMVVVNDLINLPD